MRNAIYILTLDEMMSGKDETTNPYQCFLLQAICGRLLKQSGSLLMTARFTRCCRELWQVEEEGAS